MHGTEGDWQHKYGAELLLNPGQMVCGLQCPPEDGVPGQFCGATLSLTKSSVDRYSQHLRSHTKKGPWIADATALLMRMERLKAHLAIDGPDAPADCHPPPFVLKINPDDYATYVPLTHTLTGSGPIVTGANHVRPGRGSNEPPAMVTTTTDVALALRAVVDDETARNFAASAGIKPWSPRAQRAIDELPAAAPAG
jgi:hypothetical protein